jgi:hypothetical protein
MHRPIKSLCKNLAGLSLRKLGSDNPVGDIFKRGYPAHRENRFLKQTKTNLYYRQIKTNPLLKEVRLSSFPKH